MYTVHSRSVTEQQVPNIGFSVILFIIIWKDFKGDLALFKPSKREIDELQN